MNELGDDFTANSAIFVLKLIGNKVEDCAMMNMD
jgi:hypothetical protein